MTDTTYVDSVGPYIVAAWLNDVNNWAYRGTQPVAKDVVVNGLTVGKGNNSYAHNTVLGVSAGSQLLYNANVYATYSADYNTFVGGLAGSNVTSGFYNTFLGYNAGGKSSSSQSVGVGLGAGSVTGASIESVFIGAYAAGQANTRSSAGDVIIGYIAAGGYRGAIGSSATTAATALVAGTYYAIDTVGTTDFTLVGAVSNTVGIGFIATGAGTGSGTAYNNLAAQANVIIGYSANPGLSGAQGVYLGASVAASGNTNTNEIVIGSASTGNGSNTTTLGGNGSGSPAVVGTYFTGAAPAAAAATPVGLFITGGNNGGNTYGFFYGTGSPNGTVSALNGSLYSDVTTNAAKLWFNTSNGVGTTWTQITIP